MEYSTRVKKALWPQWNIPSRFMVPMEKVWFEVVIVMVKDKKILHKRHNVNQNWCNALHEVAEQE